MTSSPGGSFSVEGRDTDRDAGQTPAHYPLQRGTSFDDSDHVFPIRSVVSVNPEQPDSSSPTREGARHLSVIDADTYTSGNINEPSTSPSAVEYNPNLESTGTGQNRPDETSHGLVTSRFEHVLTESGHAVTTGKPGEFQACEDEPIRIPGAVQSFGALVALREEENEQFLVRIASENSKSLLGYSPNELFELNNFLDILKDDHADTLLDHIDLVREGTFDPTIDGPDVFLLSLSQLNRKPRRFWVAIHICPSDPGLIVCEFEPEDDHVNPLNVSGRGTPTAPVATLGSEPTPEMLASSTSSLSQPLRVLRNARRRRGEAATMEVFSILTQIQNQLSRTDTLDSLLNTTTGLVKELTGFHRVLIYQFDVNWNGTTVAELLDPRASKDLYKGLHFPASDIPKQARELYKTNKVRLLYDRDQVTSRLVCRTAKDLETPLDMTHAYLRAMSPIHIKYLANMEIRASMSISITGFNELWGLISCHSYGDSGMRVSFPIRKMCRLIGDTVSRNIERLSYASRLHARKLINTSPTDANPSEYIIASSDDLLKLFDADYGALCIQDEIKVLGKPSYPQEVLALLEYLKIRRINSVLASHNLAKDFPDMRYAPGFKQISGLLYVPLSADGSDFIAFFRRGQLTEIKWAGNPYDKKIVDGHLQPRKSFQAWRETVLDRSREWSETDVDTAAVLCLVYGKFISVWRQKEAAMEKSQLTRLLLANTAHEVRTPLNAIINYLEIAMEGALDAETRDNLTKSHSASKSLIYVINDLLDLTNTEKGQNLIKDESFDLPDTIKEAVDMLESETKRKGIVLDVQTWPGLPVKVLGDQRRIRHVISNLISNAIRHTSRGGVAVEIWRAPVQPENGDVMVEMTVLDTGSGMSQGMLEALFQQLEQVPSIDDSEGHDALPSLQEEQDKPVLGLGLALVARVVRNMQGQLSVRSQEGKGSRFKISLQFPIPDGTDQTADMGLCRSSRAAEPPTPFHAQQEFILVDSNVAPRHGERRHSTGGNRSRGSLQSGGSIQSNKSEADRLITAIQEPLLVRSTSEGSNIQQSKQELSPGDLSGREKSKTSNSIPDEQTPDFSPGPNVRTTVPPVSLPPGLEHVTESGVPMGAVHVEQPSTAAQETEALPESGPPAESFVQQKLPSVEMPESFRVLVAEDDPINSKIVQKRLQKLGHTVRLTGNGEECAAAYRAGPSEYDVALMDIQVCLLPALSYW